MYRPADMTPSGIFLSRNSDKWPPIFGHVLSVPQACPHNVKPGDFIMYKRYAESPLEEEPFLEPNYPGEVAHIALLNCEDIQLIFPQPPEEVRL